ncbi:MAG: ribosome-associated translation inhibitor RaiA [Ignavibacteriae bacterium]|nr:MAG: ribosome-associated translation inhibitor RaiA [Ignavibacteriota bacterium]
MNINITSRKFKARESLKTFISDEVNSLLKYNDDILDADVILSFQSSKDSIKVAEITLRIPGQSLIATDITDDFEKSVSSTVEKLISQLKKIKSKRATRIK